MDEFKVGQQVELITDPEKTPFSKYMLEIMGYPTKVLGTIACICNEHKILIHSNQLEEHGLGHSGGSAEDYGYNSRHERGHWWVGDNHIKPYHEQPSFSDLDKLDKLFKEENNE